MLFMSSLLGIGVMVVQLNVSLKKDTWDSVTREYGGTLAFRII